MGERIEAKEATTKQHQKRESESNTNDLITAPKREYSTQQTFGF